MGRRPKALQREAKPLLSGQVLWSVQLMASEGAMIVGRPLGLRPRKATPWQYKLEAQAGSAEMKERDVEALAHQGYVKGVATSENGQPIQRFTITKLGLEALGRIEGAKTR